MLKLISSEWIKIRKSAIWIPVFIGPILAVCVGLMEVSNNHEYASGTNHWIWLYPKVISFYSLMFLPLSASIIAALICRYEHAAGGWKQLCVLPVSRSQVYLVKILYSFLFLALTQVLLLLAIIAVGIGWGISDPIPWSYLLKGIVGGVVSLFPLGAVNVWLCSLWRSFGIPFAINMVLTIPNIVIIYSDSFSPYYPWAQPFNAMFPSNYVPLNMAPGSLLWIVIVGTAIAVVGGCLHFKKKDVLS